MNINKKYVAWAALAAVAVLIIGFTMCSTADAREFYVKVEAGQTIETDVDAFGSLPNGDVLGAYVGSSVGPVRVEAGVANVTFDTGIPIADIDANYYNASGNIDLANGLYFGGGAGYIESEAEFGPFSASDEGWAWHLQGGYAHRLTDSLVAEFQVRYIDADFDTLGEATSTAATVGLRMAL